MDLRRVEELNKKLPRVLSEGIIDEFRRHVEVDEEQLNQYLKGEKADFHKICVRSAEAAVEVAEADLQRERALHERLRSTSSEMDVERAAAVAELAKLNLERIRSQEPSESVLTHLQWQIEELRNEVLELRLKK